jgi:hypothetical protein
MACDDDLGLEGGGMGGRDCNRLASLDLRLPLNPRRPPALTESSLPLYRQDTVTHHYRHGNSSRKTDGEYTYQVVR